jgi:hypothetical protein
VNAHRPKRGPIVWGLALSGLIVSACVCTSGVGQLLRPVATLSAASTRVSAAGQTLHPTFSALEATHGPTIAAAAATAASGAGTAVAQAGPSIATAAVVVWDIASIGDASLQNAWDGTYGLQAGVPFTVSANEEQVRSLIERSLGLAGWGGRVSDVQVGMGLGQIRIDFTLDAGLARIPASVTFQPTLDPQGHLLMNLVSANFGGQQAPPGLVDALGEAVAWALTGSRTEQDRHVTLTTISIDSGMMTVSGYLTP